MNISGRLIWAGVAATVVMTAMMMFVAPIMGVHVDIAASLAEMMKMPWMVGMATHLMLGVIVFPLVYAVLFVSQAPSNPVPRGLIFGVVLWLMMEVAGMPMLGAGFFGVKGPGSMGAVAALLAHLAYGAILASVAAGRRRAVEFQAV